MYKVFEHYPISQRIVIFLFVFDLFAWLVAPFSKYYVSHIEVYSDLACLASLIFLGNGICSGKNIEISVYYFFVCIAIIIIPVFLYGDTPFVAVLSKLIFAISFISLKARHKWTIYRVFVRILSIILFLGIIEWILYLFGLNFFWAIVERNGVQPFYQGIFILMPTYSFEGYARFMSLCTEPGGLGTLCFFLLTTLDYHQYKKEFLVLLTAGLLSFSLGFYVLIGSWVLIQRRKFALSQYALSAIAVVLMLTLFGKFFEERIVERVSGRSFEQIDNRVDENVDRKFQEISKDSRIFIGMGNRTFYEWRDQVGGVSAGVKSFIMQYGLVGLMLLIIGFSSLIMKVRGINTNTIILLIFVWIAFYKSIIWNNPPLLLPLLTVPIDEMMQLKARSKSNGIKTKVKA